MITESFINSCFTLLLNKHSKVRKTKDLYRDVLDVIEFSEKQKTTEPPLSVKGKLECLKKIAEMLMGDKTVDNIIDSISFSEKFDQYKDFLDVKVTEKLNDMEMQDIIKQVRLRKKIAGLFQNYDELNNVLDSIKDGTFDSIDDLVDDYEATIKTLYSNMMENNRSVTLEAAASLDLSKDEYDHVIEMIRKKYERTSTTSTGFKMLDVDVMNGGYEPSRLYVYGGGSGAGKSTILNNTIYKSAITPINLMQQGAEPIKQGEIRKVYIYVTLENTIEESLMRTYQPMFCKEAKEMLSDISNKVDIKQLLNKELSKSGSTIIMKYFPPMSVSPLDLTTVIDDVIDEYGKDSIAGLYIDYLDLLRSDTRYDIYRLELGHITLSLKTLAVQYNIPVITASQLGRSIYKISDSKDLGLDLMSESIKKVEHADFVMLLAKDRNDDETVHGMVGKNRSGKSNVSIEFKVDFSKYRFISANPRSNKQKDTCSTGFGGLDGAF